MDKPYKNEAVGTRKEFAIFLTLVVGFCILFYFLLKDTKQTIGATVFIATVIGTLMFWKFRVAIAFLGIVVLLLTRTINLSKTIEYMSLDVIIFLMGMMVIVGLVRQSGFLRWLLAKGLKISKFEPNRLMIIILTMAAVMAALVDEVTSILIITALVLDLCDYFKVSPVKYIISVVFATNIGSSWTVMGNPIGILIALRSGLTFEDFMQTAFPIGVISLLGLMVIVLIWQKNDLRLLKEKVKANSEKDRMGLIEKLAEIKDKKLFIGSVVIFVMIIIALALHSRIELLLELEKNTLLVASSITGAGVVMLWQRHQARYYIQKEVDWWVLVFFMFLFGKAGCLQYVGISDVITNSMLTLSGGGNLPILTVMILWLSGFASAAMDNLVVVAGLVPTLVSLTDQLGTPVLWWALLLGGCYGGNMTMVGSTANIVALGMLESRVGYDMKLSYWIKIGLLGSLVPMAVGTVALLIFG